MSNKHCVLVHLNTVAATRELHDLLNTAGFEVVLAGNTDELREILNCRPIDCLILSDKLQGFLTGRDIIERMSVDLLRPRTILIGQFAGNCQRSVKDLGIDVVLAPTATAEEVCRATSNLVRADGVNRVLIPERARQMVASFEGIAPLPQLVLQLATRLDQAEISPDVVAQDFSIDPNATAELLKIANSSAFGRHRQAANVHDAVMYLGARRAITLFVSSQLMKNQAKLAQNVSDDQRLWYNQRSVLVANAAETFAELYRGGLPSQTVFVLGLFQELGILVLAQNQKNRYRHILRRFRTVGQLRLDLIETQEFGIHHGHVSAAILQKWNMPQSFVKLVMSHHDDMSMAQHSKVDKHILKVMQVAENLANLSEGHLPQRYPTFQKSLFACRIAGADAIRSAIATAVDRAVVSCEIYRLPEPDSKVLLDITARLLSDEPIIQSEESEEVQTEIADSRDSNLPADPEKFARAKPRILLVEDDPLVMELLVRSIQELDCDAICCKNVDEALRNIEQAAVVLTDVHLERGRSGIDLLRTLQSNGYKGPTLVISGDRTRQTVSACLEAGACDYILKPFSVELLIEKLSIHIENRTNVPAGCQGDR